MPPMPADMPHMTLAQARRRNAGALWAVALFSLFTNALMLTGPLYMLQVYDRVLASRSEETLLALTLLAVFLFLMMGVLDHARGRVAARVGARMQGALDAPVFAATLARARRRRGAQTGLQDLEAVQRLVASPVGLTLFDLPYTPLFLAAVFLFHPWLGCLALGGGALLIIIALINQSCAREPLTNAGAASLAADRMAGQLHAEADLIRSLGMQDAGFARWRRHRAMALAFTIRAADRVGGFGTLTRTLRLFLQSAMLGLGALLVLHGQLTAGAMIASSILMGRALAPIEIAIGHWPAIARARQGWTALAALLVEEPPPVARLPLPRPAARLQIQHVSVMPPGAFQATLRGVSFTVEPGQAIGVIGPSGAGKSTLARALTGVWPPAAGHIRLDGATLDQYDPEVLGALIGYLPQAVALFDGTIADNIARLAINPDPAAVVAAARAADAHEMILRQPQGYDTWITATGACLSGGQMQRIGLARALYGDPVLLVLDEPNANLDNDGTDALNRAIAGIKAVGGAALIMAHRPAAIRECDRLLVLDAGAPRLFGPTAEVLKRMIANDGDIRRAAGRATGAA